MTYNTSILVNQIGLMTFSILKQLAKDSYKANPIDSRCALSVLHGKPVILRFNNTMIPGVASSTIRNYLKKYLPHLINKEVRVGDGTYQVALNEADALNLMQQLKAEELLSESTTSPPLKKTRIESSSSTTVESIPFRDIGKTVVISLEMMRTDGIALRAFENLSAQEKIQLISKRIEIICNQLRLQFPNDLWIIGWREYGITEAQSRFISEDTLNYFKESMLCLTTSYPNLAILAGTVAVKRHFDHEKYQEKLPKILEEYANLDDLRAHEGSASSIRRQKDGVLELERQRSATRSTNGVDVISNTTYLFQNQTIQKHRKVGPWIETWDSLRPKAPGSKHYMPEPNTIYRTASKKTRRPEMTLIHPTTKHTIPIGVEICYEHRLWLLKTSAIPKQLIHFVLSDSTDTDLDRAHGEVFLQFDSVAPLQPIFSGIDGYRQVKVFRHDLLTPNGIGFKPVTSYHTMDFNPTRTEAFRNNASTMFAGRSGSPISKWTVLLSNWINATNVASQTKASEELRIFSIRCLKKLPMTYLLPNGNAASILDLSKRDSNLYNELLRRQKIYSKMPSSTKTQEQGIPSPAAFTLT